MLFTIIALIVDGVIVLEFDVSLPESSSNDNGSESNVCRSGDEQEEALLVDICVHSFF